MDLGELLTKMKSLVPDEKKELGDAYEVAILATVREAVNGAQAGETVAEARAGEAVAEAKTLVQQSATIVARLRRELDQAHHERDLAKIQMESNNLILPPPYQAPLLQASTSSVKDIFESFWDTQPILSRWANEHYILNLLISDVQSTENTWIKPSESVEDIRKEPFILPESFVWSDVDIHNPEELTELYKLLAENYVEDDENMFRFYYSPLFLRW